MAMKVFEKAETCYAKMARPSTSLEGQWGNPDLRLSRGLARRHVEDYKGAIDDFRAAHALDPSLNAGDMAEDLSRWVKRVADLWERNAALKPKQSQKLGGEALHHEGAGRLQEHGALSPEQWRRLPGCEALRVESANQGKCLSLVVALELRRGARCRRTPFCASPGTATSVLVSLYRSTMWTANAWRRARS